MLEPENGSILMRSRFVTLKRSALSQHVIDFDHRIDWDNVKILKLESHPFRRRCGKFFDKLKSSFM